MSTIKYSERNKDFFDQVYQLVRLVPPGRVSSFGAIAKYLGAARSARMVGWALGNSIAKTPPVPAHRILNRKGLLSGKMAFGADDTMQKLLEAEGIKVVNDQVQDFEKIFWDPAQELKF